MNNHLWRKPPGKRFINDGVITRPTPDELELMIDILEEVESPEYDRLLEYAAARGATAVPRLAAILEKSQGYRALVVVCLLSDLGGDQAHAVLYETLLYRNWPGDDQLADEVALKLEKNGGLSAPRLIAALADPRAEVRARAAWYLHWITAPADLPRIVEAVLPMAADPDAHVRDCVATVLRQVSDARAVPALMTILRQAQIPSHKINVLSAFEQMPDRRAVHEIVPLLKDADAWVRARAASALGAIGDEQALAPLLESIVDEPERTFAADALVKLDRFDHANDYLIAILEDDEQPTALRARAAEILGHSRDARTTAILRQCACGPDDRLRLSALVGLSKLGDPESMQLVVDAITDPVSWVRRGVIEVFTTLKCRQAVAPLIQGLEQMINSVDLYYVVMALRHQGDPRAVAPLQTLIDYTHPANVELLEAIHTTIAELQTPPRR